MSSSKRFYLEKITYPERIQVLQWDGGPHRSKSIRKQTYGPATHDEHECVYVLCDDCDVPICECYCVWCEFCYAALCEECSISTEEGPSCQYCCTDGMSYIDGERTRELIAVVDEWLETRSAESLKRLEYMGAKIREWGYVRPEIKEQVNRKFKGVFNND